MPLRILPIRHQMTTCSDSGLVCAQQQLDVNVDKYLLLAYRRCPSVLFRNIYNIFLEVSLIYSWRKVLLFTSIVFLKKEKKNKKGSTSFVLWEVDERLASNIAKQQVSYSWSWIHRFFGLAILLWARWMDLNFCFWLEAQIYSHHLTRNVQSLPKKTHYTHSQILC